jgi:hypothetical protein
VLGLARSINRERERKMTNQGQELHKKVRDAIFLEALGSWEESCTFDELSADGQQVYEGYATAAVEVFGEELAKLRAQVHELAAKIEAATTTELARANTAMEHAGHEAIEALRAVNGSPALSRDQQGLVTHALLEMFDAKPRWARKAEAAS